MWILVQIAAIFVLHCHFKSYFFSSDKYTAGLRVCPLKFVKDRAVLYANRGQMKRVLGLNDHAIRNCTKALELDPQYLKALLRRAEIYEETDKLGTIYT